jgi:hypothetical protein
MLNFSGINHTLTHLNTSTLINKTAEPNKNWKIWPKGKMFSDITQKTILIIDNTYKKVV